MIKNANHQEESTLCLLDMFDEQTTTGGDRSMLSEENLSPTMHKKAKIIDI